MKTIQTANGTIGKFTDYEELSDRVIAGGCVYMKDMLGAYTLVNYVEPVITPEIIVPQTVTMRQARLALLQAGSLSAVNSAIAGMTGSTGEAARIEWEFSSEVKRNQPLVIALTPTLGFTPKQLDDLFILAATL
jgi:hypothetical protein